VEAVLREFGVTPGELPVVIASSEFVLACTTLMLVLPGIDRYRPATGREIAALAPAGSFLEPRNDSQRSVHHTVVAVRRFLEAHIPRQVPK
jgi:hypothetical protein